MKLELKQEPNGPKIPSPELACGILRVWYDRLSGDWNQQIKTARATYPDYRGNLVCLPWPPARRGKAA
jgi:hypothetical protein